MALMKIQTTTIAFLTLLAAGVTTTLSPVKAATKIQTQKIILPTEDADDRATDQLQTTIPDSALPEPEALTAPEVKPTPEVQPETDNDASQPEPASEQTSQPMEAAPLPPVLRDVNLLPNSVRETHKKLIGAAMAADLEQLRALIGSGETATTLSIGGLEGDPIEFLKETSGDADGYELLAILLEVLEAGFVHVDAGTDSEMYIWPYFFTWPFEKLTPQMKVELFRILTAGDVQDSTDFGGYIFYRVGIRPDGRWDFFVAGD